MARGLTVDDGGVVVPATLAGALDVQFDGQRVWSFNPARDGHPADGGRHRADWPAALRRHLDGTTEVRLVDHLSREVLHTQRVRFGQSSDPIRVVDAEGHPLAIDKGGRLQRDFSNTDSSTRVEIMDALERVVEDLVERCGLETYLMYGCLLGAVRTGHMIGHDSDADLAFLSKYTHPFDIVRETTEAVRCMRRLGWNVARMSGANFKVWVALPDGRRCGIDVFGSFHIGESFWVTGSLKGSLDLSSLVPFGTVTLEGREIVAPNRPEDLLSLAYGPTWRVPDPAFHFDYPTANIRQMDAWFRATRRRMRFWQNFYKSPDAGRVPTDPSPFAAWVQARLDGTGHVLDVGAGTGRDSLFFAGRGHRVTAFEYTMLGFSQTRALREEQGLKVSRRWLNLEDLRAVLVTGARLAHRGGTRQVYARGLLDTLGDAGRSNFWRFASMVQRRGGETFVEFRTPASRTDTMFFGAHQRTFVDPDAAVREIEAHGGTVVHREEGRGRARLGREDPHICRLVVRWT